MPRKPSPPPSGTRSPSPKLRCASCGKETRARHADILQGWYSGENGSMYCSWACTQRVPKPKGRKLNYFVRTTVQGATKPADVDRWFRVVVAPVLLKAFGDDARARPDAADARRIAVREFILSDYDRALMLWKSCDGIVLRDVDERQPLRRYLARNRGLSFVYEAEGEIGGVVLCGTDGRRGFLHHLAVAADQRRHGVGRALVAKALDALARQGINKCHLMVLPTNDGARAFWKRIGWVERTDVLLMSKTIDGGPDA